MGRSVFGARWLGVVLPVTTVIWFTPTAYAQTAACCCSDQWDVLDEVGCDAWGATFDPPRECDLLAAADCSYRSFPIQTTWLAWPGNTKPSFSAATVSDPIPWCLLLLMPRPQSRRLWLPSLHP